MDVHVRVVDSNGPRVREHASMRCDMTINSSTGTEALRHPASVRELRREFALADLDNDNRIDLEEFRRLLEGLQAGMSENEVRIGFQEIDTDRDGAIDRDEFIQWWTSD